MCLVRMVGVAPANQINFRQFFCFEKVARKRLNVPYVQQRNIITILLSPAGNAIFTLFLHS